MFFIPFPFIFVELVIFILAVQRWGFGTVLGFYFLPSLLGILIVSIMGRVALLSLQNAMARGQLPGDKILSSGALFLSGLLFIIPSFFSRALGLCLFLPGLRHLLIWRFKISMARRMAQGSARVFNFGAGRFGFGTGAGAQSPWEFGNFEERPIQEERDVTTDDVVDVQPLEITHEKKESQE